MVVAAVAVAMRVQRIATSGVLGTSREESDLTPSGETAAAGLREHRERRLPVGAPVSMVDIEGVPVESVGIPLRDADVKDGEIALCVDDGWLLDQGRSSAVGTYVGYLRRLGDDEGDLDFRDQAFVVSIAVGGG
jgi:hypothetical protein